MILNFENKQKIRHILNQRQYKDIEFDKEQLLEYIYQILEDSQINKRDELNSLLRSELREYYKEDANQICEQISYLFFHQDLYKNTYKTSDEESLSDDYDEEDDRRRRYNKKSVQQSENLSDRLSESSEREQEQHINKKQQKQQNNLNNYKEKDKQQINNNNLHNFNIMQQKKHEFIKVNQKQPPPIPKFQNLLPSTYGYIQSNFITPIQNVSSLVSQTLGTQPTYSFMNKAPPPPASKPPLPPPQSLLEQKNVIYVFHIPPNLNDIGKLSNAFSKFGNIISCDKIDSTTASIKFEKEESARKALESKEKPFKRSQIIVQQKKIPIPPKPAFEQIKKEIKTNLEGPEKVKFIQQENNIAVKSKPVLKIDEKKRLKLLEDSKRIMGLKLAEKAKTMIFLKQRETEESKIKKEVQDDINKIREMKNLLNNCQTVNDVNKLEEHQLLANNMYDFTLLIKFDELKEVNMPQFREKMLQFGRVEHFKKNIKENSIEVSYIEYQSAESAYFLLQNEFNISFMYNHILKFLVKPQVEEECQEQEDNNQYEQNRQKENENQNQQGKHMRNQNNINQNLINVEQQMKDENVFDFDPDYNDDDQNHQNQA